MDQPNPWSLQDIRNPITYACYSSGISTVPNNHHTVTQGMRHREEHTSILQVMLTNQDYVFCCKMGLILQATIGDYSIHAHNCHFSLN